MKGAPSALMRSMKVCNYEKSARWGKHHLRRRYRRFGKHRGREVISDRINCRTVMGFMTNVHSHARGLECDDNLGSKITDTAPICNDGFDSACGKRKRLSRNGRHNIKFRNARTISRELRNIFYVKPVRRNKMHDRNVVETSTHLPLASRTSLWSAKEQNWQTNYNQASEVVKFSPEHKCTGVVHVSPFAMKNKFRRMKNSNSFFSRILWLIIFVQCCYLAANNVKTLDDTQWRGSTHKPDCEAVYGMSDVECNSRVEPSNDLCDSWAVDERTNLSNMELSRM